MGIDINRRASQSYEKEKDDSEWGKEEDEGCVKIRTTLVIY